jgi:hypothetical protein
MTLLVDHVPAGKPVTKNFLYSPGNILDTLAGPYYVNIPDLG